MLGDKLCNSVFANFALLAYTIKAVAKVVTGVINMACSLYYVRVFGWSCYDAYATKMEESSKSSLIIFLKRAACFLPKYSSSEL